MASPAAGVQQQTISPFAPLASSCFASCLEASCLALASCLAESRRADDAAVQLRVVAGPSDVVLAASASGPDAPARAGIVTLIDVPPRAGPEEGQISSVFADAMVAESGLPEHTARE